MVAALPFTSFIGNHAAQCAFHKPFAYPRLFQLPPGASDGLHGVRFVACARSQNEATSEGLLFAPRHDVFQTC